MTCLDSGGLVGATTVKFGVFRALCLARQGWTTERVHPEAVLLALVTGDVTRLLTITPARATWAFGTHWLLRLKDLLSL